MEIKKRLLKKTSLERLVERLNSEGKSVFAPVRQDTRVEFASISKLEEMTNDYIVTRQSPKFVAFPKIEPLLHYQIGRDSVESTGASTAAFPEIIVLGSRPCDADGFDSLTAIFNWDYKDHLYNERLQRVTLISISCPACDAYCFCTSVKGHPGSTRGSDLLLTRFDTGDYLAEIVTEKGQKLLDLYPELFEEDPGIDKNAFLADVPQRFDIEYIVKKTGAIFEHPVWLEQSLRCIGCGACAYVCPTCACFDIQDEGAINKGERIRCWDSCGFGLFTIHTTGHNPREVQSQRWRQRVLHKFSYMPERLSVIGCVGCGRCSRACPVDMNLSEHLVSIAEV